MTRYLSSILFVLLAVVVNIAAADNQISPTPTVYLPETSIHPRQLAVVYNSTSPLSIQVAEYYAKVRKIPQKNLIGVAFDSGQNVMEQGDFKALRVKVDSLLPSGIQAMLLLWKTPYRVECMSITSAFAVGYDEDYCASGCKPTKRSPYAGSKSVMPYRDYGIRPTMLLPFDDFQEAKTIIDRGVRADHSNPSAKALLVNSNDKNRNVRSVVYERAFPIFNHVIQVETVDSGKAKDQKDVAFYFIGRKQVEYLGSNQFVPGAIADHLTSFGGHMDRSGSQMSILRWLDAGATGSYGTVIEPCNFLEKFPNPLSVMHFYLSGSTLIEAYWKSVIMPGQGLFVGEPLARPFTKTTVEYAGDVLSIKSMNLLPGRYKLEGANDYTGPFVTLKNDIKVFALNQQLRIPTQYFQIYRLSPSSTW